MHRRTFHQTMLAASLAVVAPQLVRRPPSGVDGARLIRLFDALARFGATPAGGVHRVAYSDADRAARAWFAERMREAGLVVRVDTAANIIGRRGGTEPSLPPLVTGSHIDSVPDGGKFDGNVGSVGALEVAWSLRDRDVATRHPIDFVVFQNEEGGLVGSEAMAGALTETDLAHVSTSGLTIADGIRSLGGDPARLHEARRGSGDMAAYVELHIEQGGTLDAAGIDIGVVEGIVGIRWWDVTVDGFANHAGTTPMDRRQDALLAAARFVDAVHRAARARPGRQVATVGRIRALPGAPNVVPGRVEMSLEIRDLDADVIAALFAQLETEAAAIGEATGTRFTFANMELDAIPALTDDGIRRAIEASADALGLTHRRLPSGAGHDAQSFRTVAPLGMIFVPSVRGISHSPREYTEPADLVRGADVLLSTLLRLDADLQP